MYDVNCVENRYLFPLPSEPEVFQEFVRELLENVYRFRLINYGRNGQALIGQENY